MCLHWNPDKSWQAEMNTWFQIHPFWNHNSECTRMHFEIMRGLALLDLQVLYYLYDHPVGDKEIWGEMVWLLRFNLPDILLKLLLSFLCASFQLTLSDLQASFKLPAGFHLALLQASFELASSIPLSFLQAYLQLPSGLSLSSLWALPQNCLKLAWSFLQACFVFPSNLFWLPASFLEVAFRFLQLASNMLPACFMLPPSCLWASLELALSLF